MSRRKKVLIISCIIIGILIVLDFIPIKFAYKHNDFKNINTENVYISEHTAVTGGDWYANQEINPWLSESVDFILQDEKVFGNISKIYTTESEEPSYNHFVYWGTMKQKQVADNFTINILEAEKWNVVYPIKRKSIRNLYAPKGYFTIYDYDWIKVIKGIFG